jgi:hypothetical protein
VRVVKFKTTDPPARAAAEPVAPAFQRAAPKTSSAKTEAPLTSADLFKPVKFKRPAACVVFLAKFISPAHTFVRCPPQDLLSELCFFISVFSLKRVLLGFL